MSILDACSGTEANSSFVDSETCREETKVRTQVRRQQTLVFWQQKAIEQSPHSLLEHMRTSLQQVWASLDDGASLALHESDPESALQSRATPYPISLSAPDDSDTLRHRHVYTKSPLVFCYASDAARPHVTIATTALIF
jgi:hypothetical protein